MRLPLLLAALLALISLASAQNQAPPGVFEQTPQPGLFGGGDLQTALEANAKSDPALGSAGPGATPGFSRNPDGSLNLDLTEQPILTVFRLLAAMERLNFIAPALKGDERITLNLVRVTPRTAFQMIAAARGFRVVENGGVVTLERSDALSPQAYLTRTYRLNHARVAVIAQAVGNLLGIDLAKPDASSPAYPEPVQVGGSVGVTDAQARPRFTSALPMSEKLSRAGETTIFFTRRTNQLIVRATAAQHEQVAALLASLDRDVPQIAMTCYVLEIADGQDQGVGVDWSKTLGPQGLRLGLGAQSSAGGSAPILKLSNALLYQGAVLSLSDAEVAVRALRNLSHTKSLGSPNLLVQPGVPSQIVNLEKETVALVNTVASGSVATQNTSLQTFVTGLTIDVIADLLPDGRIGLNLSPRISARTGVTRSSIGDIPRTSERGTTADVIVPDGSAIVLGGILSARDERGTAEVPLLGRIPVLGALFRSQSTNSSRTNLVIVVTARTLRTPSRQRFGEAEEQFLRTATNGLPQEPAYRYGAEPAVVYDRRPQVTPVPPRARTDGKKSVRP